MKFNLPPHIEEILIKSRDKLTDKFNILKSQCTLSSFSLPKFSWPDLSLSNFSVPPIDWPRVSIPKITLPKMAWPQIDMPHINWVSLRIPAWSSIPIKIPRNLTMFCFLLGFLMIGVMLSFSLSIAYGLNVPETKVSEAKIDNKVEDKIITLNQDNVSPPKPMTLSEVMAEKNQAENQVKPTSTNTQENWQPEQTSLKVETVLVPRRVTVISSSQDGQIAEVVRENGEEFKKGDILVRYHCKDLEAEAEIAGIQKNLTEQKRVGGDKLFKLDLISDVERLSILTEDKEAKAKIALYEARLESCVIRAEFDGRVTKRLANAGEYTRTDRVLMEVASNDPLQAQFLLPSKWLRWVDAGAPITITLNETGRSYEASITRLYGEIDPVSQSIQVVATLTPYTDRLLPGMSGQATLDINSIREAGIDGYLQAAKSP
jgi:membrane fusion protein (multidrug efflux system)